MENEGWGRKAVELSECIFYTGGLEAEIPNQVVARDAVDELFTHSDGVSAPFFQELKQLGIRLPEPPIRVVSLTPGPIEIPFLLDGARAFASDMRRLLPSFVEETGLFYYVNGRIQGIVSTKNQSATRRLYDGLHSLVCRDPTERKPHAAISNCYGSLSDISRACDENQEALQFERFLTKPIEVIVQPRDFFLYGIAFRQDRDEDIFGTLSQRICNAMIMDDRSRGHRTLDETLDYMVDRFPRVSGVHMRTLRFCHALELTLVGADLIDRLFVQEFHLLQEVIEADNEALLRDTFHRKLDEIYDYAAERKQLRHGAQMGRVAAYIDGNLTDAMLSIPTIAENFGMTEEKLSAAFRSYFQETIPNYIHQRRVAYIKKQLLDTKKPIREISLDAGYVSLATMNRAFCRLEGISPGQYRTKHRKLREP